MLGVKETGLYLLWPWFENKPILEIKILESSKSTKNVSFITRDQKKWLVVHSFRNNLPSNAISQAQPAYVCMCQWIACDLYLVLLNLMLECSVAMI